MEKKTITNTLRFSLIIFVILITACEDNYLKLDRGCPLDRDTSIFIYFDSSGSMDATLLPLQTMVNPGGPLYNSLINMYGEELYRQRVKIIPDISECTLDFLNLRGIQEADLPQKVIVLVFQDESSPYHDDLLANQPTIEFIAHLNGLTTRLNTHYSDCCSYKAVIFQINDGYPAFKEFLKSIEKGTAPYIAPNNLVPYITGNPGKISIQYDVTPSATADYYFKLIQKAVDALGTYIADP